MSEIKPLSPEEQFTLKDIVVKLVKFKNLVVRNWKVLLIAAVVGSLLGTAFDFFTKKEPLYTANILFNMENGAVSGEGGLAEIASAFGMGGGGAGNANLFSGDNFMELVKTHNIYNRALLKMVDYKGQKVIFANLFLAKSGAIEDDWKKDESFKNFRYKHNNYAKFTVEERNKLRSIQVFLDPITSIKPANTLNKKSTFLTLSVKTRNDTLSHIWAETFLETVTEFYIETKTKKTRELLTIVDRRVDSLKNQLYGTQRRYAQLMDRNQQVIMQQGLLEQQRLSASSSQLQGMYFDAVRSLDQLKFSMVKESPLLTILDDSELPIGADFAGINKGRYVGAFVGFVLMLLYVAIKKVLEEVKQDI